MFQVIEEHPNYVLFQNIYNQPVFYELRMNTIHKLTNESSSLLSRIRSLKICSRFSFQWEHIEKSLDNEIEKMVLEVTQRCNARCGYCVFSGNYYGERVHVEKRSLDMDEKVLHQSINFLSRRSPRKSQLTFYGGEPLLRFDLIHTAIRMGRRKIGVLGANLTTNFLLGYDYAELLMENGIDIAVSLDGPPDINDSFRKTGGGIGLSTYIQKGLDKIQQISKNYHEKIIFVVTLSDPSKLSDVRNYFEERYPLNNLRINLVEERNIIKPLDTYSPESMEQFRLIVEKLALEYIDCECQDQRKSSVFLRALFMPLIKPIQDRRISKLDDGAIIPLHGTCIPGIYSVFVSVDGTMYVCEKLSGHQPIGHISSGFDKSAIQNMYKFNSDFRNEKCNNCWARRLCNQCFYATKHGEYTTPEAKELSCKQQKSAILSGLSIYSAIENRRLL